MEPVTKEENARRHDRAMRELTNHVQVQQLRATTSRRVALASLAVTLFVGAWFLAVLRETVQQVKRWRWRREELADAREAVEFEVQDHMRRELERVSAKVDAAAAAVEPTRH